LRQSKCINKSPASLGLPIQVADGFAFRLL
jgi:hypothetical protein